MPQITLIVPRNDIYEHSYIMFIQKFTPHLRRFSETLIQTLANIKSKCVRMFVSTSLYETGPSTGVIHKLLQNLSIAAYFSLNEIIQAWTSFPFTFIHVQSTFISCHLNCRDNLGLESRTFSLKINKLPTFY